MDHGWIVQERESGLMLCPLDGDVGFTSRLLCAGLFDSAEEAVVAAIDHAEPADIVEIWINRRNAG